MLHTAPTTIARVTHGALSRVAACVLTLGAGALLASLGGCGEALMAENEPRSQYDRYDTLRGQRPAAEVEDEFGSPKKNIRGRLLRRE